MASSIRSRGERSGISGEDLEIPDAQTESAETKDNTLRGGFKYGLNHRALYTLLRGR